MPSQLINNLFLFALLLLLSSSCATVLYPSNDHIIVGPSEKGSLELTASVYDTHQGERETFYDERFAYGIQTGYSPINHLSLIGNYFRTVNQPSSQNDESYVGNIYKIINKIFTFIMEQFWLQVVNLSE